MDFKNLVIIFCITFIFLISCSENKEDSELNIDEPIETTIQVDTEYNESELLPPTIAEPIEMIIVVEPENISINEIPDTLTITIENTSNSEWQGGYHCAIDFFNGDDWELIYAPVFIDLPFAIEPNSIYTNIVPTAPDTINYTVGKYRIRFGFNADGWGGWYGEFSIQ